MFEDISAIDKKMKRKQQYIDELRSLATSMTMNLGERVQTSPEDRLSNIMVKIVTAENELDMMEAELKEYRERAYADIQKLDNKEWRDIVYMHYVELMPMKKISKIKGKSVGSLYMKSNRALKVLKKELT